MKRLRFLIAITVLWLAQYGCKKQNQFLDAKPNEALAVATTLADFQLMLNNENLFNINDPALGLISAEPFHITDAKWASTGTLTERYTYIWAENAFQGETPADWTVPYSQVYNANIILEGLSTLKVAVDLEDSVSQAKGMALFYRSWALCNLLQTFSVPYDSTTASTDLGIPLRLSSDPNLKSVRSTQKECYDQIISDIKSALSLLPNTTSSPTKPSKWAANAFLARLYLSLGSYVNALNYSNMCLQQNGTLNDYNLLNLPGTNTLTSGVRYLNEDIFHTIFINYSLSKYGTGELVDSPFYNLYDSNDLRKKYFFSLISPNIYFRGTYELIHGGNNYGGLATNEIYLIRAECNARQGNVNAAMADLNKLLGNRYRTGKYINRVATDANDALNKILEERRKELCFRGLRWTDLKRLNKDPQFATTLTRIVKGVVYTLRPNDPQYVFNIPDLEIQESGIQQNDR